MSKKSNTSVVLSDISNIIRIVDKNEEFFCANSNDEPKVVEYALITVTEYTRKFFRETSKRDRVGIYRFKNTFDDDWCYCRNGLRTNGMETTPTVQNLYYAKLATELFNKATSNIDVNPFDNTHTIVCGDDDDASSGDDKVLLTESAGYDMSIHSNVDCYVWADFFLQTFPDTQVDRDTMAGWFANAMMARHDFDKNNG